MSDATSTAPERIAVCFAGDVAVYVPSPADEGADPQYVLAERYEEAIAALRKLVEHMDGGIVVDMDEEQGAWPRTAWDHDACYLVADTRDLLRRHEERAILAPTTEEPR